VITHIPFPSIEQLRNVVHAIGLQAAYVGEGPNEEPLYDNTRPLPAIAFTGTVKLHGTNMSVAHNAQDGMWFQSRETVIRVGKDDTGFARFAEANAVSFKKLIDRIHVDNNLSDADTVSIYGEWAGRGIQKGNDIAIGELEKAFYIFAIKVARPQDPKFAAYWVDCAPYSDKEQRIFNINDYGHYSIEIDFSNPGAAQAELGEITMAVELECPVARAFGVTGVGEGVVWVGDYAGVIYRFKTKGDKHKVAKTRELVPVAAEKLETYTDFVDYAVTPARLDQAIRIVCGDADKVSMRDIGAVIKWMSDDIRKEETDTLQANGLTFAEVSKHIIARTKEMFSSVVNSKA